MLIGIRKSWLTISNALRFISQLVNSRNGVNTKTYSPPLSHAYSPFWTSVLSVLRFTYSDYTFGIIKLLLLHKFTVVFCSICIILLQYYNVKWSLQTYLFWHDLTLYCSGVITVDVPLDNLEINQCPQSFTVPNAFKNTARCHSKSTKVSLIGNFQISVSRFICSFAFIVSYISVIFNIYMRIAKRFLCSI